VFSTVCRSTYYVVLCSVYLIVCLFVAQSANEPVFRVCCERMLSPRRWPPPAPAPAPTSSAGGTANHHHQQQYHQEKQLQEKAGGGGSVAPPLAPLVAGGAAKGEGFSSSSGALESIVQSMANAEAKSSAGHGGVGGFPVPTGRAGGGVGPSGRSNLLPPSSRSSNSSNNLNPSTSSDYGRNLGLADTSSGTNGGGCPFFSSEFLIFWIF
jgi:hypothetical protein